MSAHPTNSIRRLIVFFPETEDDLELVCSRLAITRCEAVREALRLAAKRLRQGSDLLHVTEVPAITAHPDVSTETINEQRPGVQA